MTSTPSPLPLSATQESLWTAYRIAPHSSAYNTVLRLRVRGVVDIDALERAVEALRGRHEQLRSLFTEDRGRPCRIPLERPPGCFALHDLAEADEDELLAASQRAGLAPFRLEAEGPLRIVLVRRSPDDSVLVVAAHHVVNDFVSRVVIVRDLLDAYTDLAAGRDPQLPPVPASYADHVEKERRYVASPAGQEAAARRRHRLAGAVPAELPLDRPRPPVRSYEGDTVQRRLPADLVASLDDCAAAVGVTPFACLLAAFQVLVHRWTGRDDFLLGVPATRRAGRQLSEVVSCFTDTAPLRARFPGEVTFRDTAVAAGQEVLRGLTDSRYPSALLNRPAATGHEAGRAPLYHLALFLVDLEKVYKSVPRPPEGTPEGPSTSRAGLRISMIDTPRQQEGQLDLMVRLERGSRTISAAFSYDTDVFDRATVDGFADSFERVLRAAVGTPDMPVAEIPLTDPDELRELLALGTGDRGGSG
ncbi:condensation domain-containing protein [Streptomyces platensis]|uniref:condensation domain-containing protein n=1 Tax=Streptomyces platensis TaxID=58346 RepID=UPI0037BC5C6E